MDTVTRITAQKFIDVRFNRNISIISSLGIHILGRSLYIPVIIFYRRYRVAGNSGGFLIEKYNKRK